MVGEGVGFKVGVGVGVVFGAGAVGTVRLKSGKLKVIPPSVILQASTCLGVIREKNNRAEIRKLETVSFFTSLTLT